MEILDVELQAQELAVQVVDFSVSLLGLGGQKKRKHQLGATEETLASFT